MRPRTHRAGRDARAARDRGIIIFPSLFKTVTLIPRYVNFMPRLIAFNSPSALLGSHIERPLSDARRIYPPLYGRWVALGGILPFNDPR